MFEKWQMEVVLVRISARVEDWSFVFRSPVCAGAHAHAR